MRDSTCWRAGANTLLNIDSQAVWSRSREWVVETTLCWFWGEELGYESIGGGLVS